MASDGEDVEVIPPSKAGEDRKKGASRSAMDIAMERARERFEARAGEQLSLIVEEALPDDDRPGEASGAGKPGRPPGARNKKTEEFVSFVRAIGGDPMLGLAKATTADPLVLAAALGADPFDVWVKQQELRKAMLPYFHAARPAELKVGGGGAVAVAFFTGQGPQGDQEIDDTNDPILALQKLSEDQGLSDKPAAQSNASQSNEQPPSSDIPKG